MICPFFRKNEDYCDVGCGYISPHDVKMIVAFCQCRYQDCTKYQELANRFPRVADGPAASAVRPGTTQPEQLPRNTRPIPLVFRKKWPLPYRLRYVAGHYQQTFPTSEEDTMSGAGSRRGWSVVLAGTGINLALGILYAWSIFKSAIADSIQAGGQGAFAWTPASLNDPYAVCCLIFAAAMIVAGRVQDKFGPRLTCLIGGLLVGSGFCWISQTTSYWAWVAGFGVLAGAGMGFGYSAATPPALKWFPPARTGLIAGIVVSGFGLASVYIAPLATHLLAVCGLQRTMLIFGLVFTLAVCGLALLIANPPVAQSAVDPAAKAKPAPARSDLAVPPSRLFADARFYTLWLCYFIGAGSGLMVIGSAKELAQASLGEMAFLVVAVMAVGNAAGRLVAGFLSDKLGRANTLIAMLAFQAALMFLAIPGLSGHRSPLFVILLVTFMVFNYGTNLALFPAFAKDFWGMKHFGANYGILFSAWGVGGLLLVRLAEMLKVKTGGVTTSFAVAGVMLLVGAMMALSLRPQRLAATAAGSLPAGTEEDHLHWEKLRRP